MSEHTPEAVYCPTQDAELPPVIPSIPQEDQDIAVETTPEQKRIMYLLDKNAELQADLFSRNMRVKELYSENWKLKQNLDMVRLLGALASCIAFLIGYFLA